MPIFKKNKDVEFRSLGDTGYHIKAVIDGNRLDIISWGYVGDKKVETKAGVEVSPASAKGEVGREKESKGMIWRSIVFTPQHGFLPYEAWKKITETVSGTLSVATGSNVNPSSVEVYASAPITEIPKCPKCGAAIFIGYGKCEACGAELQ